MTGRIARRLLAVVTVSIAAAGLWSVPALAASSTDGEPDTAACAEPAPSRSPLAALGLGSPSDRASARQTCNSQKSHVDRSGEEPAEDADDAAGAEDTAGGQGAVVTDETEPVDGTKAARGDDEPAPADNSTSAPGRGVAGDS